MKKTLLIILFCIFLVGCTGNDFTRYGEIYSPQDIMNYQNIVLPLDSPEEAIEYSLSFSQVRSLLLEKNNTAYERYGENWQASATLIKPVGGNGKNFTESYREKMEKEGYIVSWHKGKECDFYGFQLNFSPDGTLLVEHMAIGWGNCK